MQNFSIPLNPKLDYESFTNRFVPFLEKNKEYIYDVYFTCRIPPFGQDAMGDVFHQGDWGAISQNALAIQENLGIPIIVSGITYQQNCSFVCIRDTVLIFVCIRDKILL